jgi:hypothetical protein
MAFLKFVENRQKNSQQVFVKKISILRVFIHEIFEKM